MRDGDDEDLWLACFAEARDQVPRVVRGKRTPMARYCEAADLVYDRMKQKTAKIVAAQKKGAAVIQLK